MTNVKEVERADSFATEGHEQLATFKCRDEAATIRFIFSSAYSRFGDLFSDGTSRIFCFHGRATSFVPRESVIGFSSFFSCPCHDRTSRE